MWQIKILTGPQAGQTFKIEKAETHIGRSEECDLVLASKGVSKDHARFVQTNEGLLIIDNGSSNGTFVNGLRVRQHLLQSGDKIGLFDVLIDVHSSAERASIPRGPAPQPAYQGNAAVWQSHQPEPARPYLVSESDPKEKAPEGFQETLQHTIENVLMPGVYRLAQTSDFRWVLASFVLGYIVLITFLSVLPMIEITKSSIERESQRRALTIANSLADRYKRALQDGNGSTFSVQSAEREEGIRAALIISAQDGHVVAPASKYGEYRDLPFINRARKKEEKFIDQIDDQLIGASVPIKVYKSEAEEVVPSAYAVVLYDMGSLAVDNDRILGLVIKVLFLAFLLGGVLFFFLYKVVEHPLLDLNRKLDHALRERRDQIHTDYSYPLIKKLVENLNSILGRAVHSQGHAPGPQNHHTDPRDQAHNLTQIMGDAAISISPEGMIYSVNPQFEDLIGARLASLQGHNISTLTDQALQLSLSDLVERSSRESHLIMTNMLEIAGRQIEIDCQAISGGQGIAYFMIRLKELAG